MPPHNKQVYLIQTNEDLYLIATEKNRYGFILQQAYMGQWYVSTAKIKNAILLSPGKDYFLSHTRTNNDKTTTTSMD
jgi:hypothetical protein